MNSDEMVFMCFKQEDTISTLNDKPLKLEDPFAYLSRNILSTENDVNTRIRKTYTAIDRLSIIWKSDH